MKSLLLLCVAGALLPSLAHADVFNLPHFVPAGDFAIGLEPELVLSSGAGVGINARYTQGLADFFSLSGEIGTGSGPRRFRAGVDLNFDFIPDLPGQPGIGMAARAMYVRIPTPGTTVGDVSGQLELTAIPYIHKAFATASGGTIDPFFSLPAGMSFLDGNYRALVTGVVGAMIQANEHFWYSAEFGIAINHTDSYFAGGITYFH
jgi:hypothetical protein